MPNSNLDILDKRCGRRWLNYAGPKIFNRKNRLGIIASIHKYGYKIDITRKIIKFLNF